MGVGQGRVCIGVFILHSFIAIPLQLFHRLLVSVVHVLKVLTWLFFVCFPLYFVQFSVSI